MYIPDRLRAGMVGRGVFNPRTFAPASITHVLPDRPTTQRALKIIRTRQAGRPAAAVRCDGRGRQRDRVGAGRPVPSHRWREQERQKPLWWIRHSVIPR
jgi:hypothetical protein